MTQPEYKQKKRECWAEFWKNDNLTSHNVNQAFSFAFDRAYALGREKEIISQYEIDEAAEDYVSFKKGGKCILSYIIERACRRAFKGGANFALGKQEKDAEDNRTLKVNRQLFCRLCADADDYINEHLEEEDSDYAYYQGRSNAMHELNEDNFAKSEPKPAEPKFKVGDTASYVCSPTLKHKCTVTKVMQNEHSGKWEYNVMFEWGKPGMWIPESDLAPYTEPEEKSCIDTCTDDCSSQCPSQNFDNIVKDSFRNERRLNIAAQIVASMVGSDDWTTWRGVTNKEIWHNMAKSSLEIADALLAEVEKKGDEE